VEGRVKGGEKGEGRREGRGGVKGREEVEYVRRGEWVGEMGWAGRWFGEGHRSGMEMGLEREMGLVTKIVLGTGWGGRWVGAWWSEMADALSEGHTLLKSGVRTDKEKLLYPPVPPRSLGEYNNAAI